MVEARLEPLPRVFQDVLVAGAVLGRFEPAKLLTAVSQSDREMVREALSRGVDAGLLTTRSGTIGFRHDVLGEAVLDTAGIKTVASHGGGSHQPLASATAAARAPVTVHSG